jgi:hypothetical protein
MSHSNAELVEGIDYYLESGRWVFTAAYHLKRGYCCQNRCRHCPYDPATISPPDTTPGAVTGDVPTASDWP